MVKKRKNIKSASSGEKEYSCKGVHGIGMLIFGLVIALNAWYGWTDAWLLLGGLLALGGLKKIFMMPMCCK
ncbi:hypothetical protein J4481_02115 [Candidatus Pacearchaeota archaeon]|nr:hypothetical protein [Candidatus Pacearchaeota archaeon]